MRTLTRYFLRLHLAPFLFAVTGLTLLLLLDQVSKRFKDLIGKDLHWSVIAEVFVYSIPFILAQTLPMAVLITVLYVYSRLEGDFEITAIKASGVPLHRVMAPLLLAATILAGGMTWFNNVVLPESNHHLQVLLTGVGRKKPTFYLRERTINEVLPSRLYVQPAAIDRERSELDDVVIYDERGGQQSRTIYASGGKMAFEESGEDLYLDLSNGILQERPNRQPSAFRRIEFDRLVMRVPAVTNSLERDTISGYRSDREMNIEQMRAEAKKGERTVATAQTESRGYAIAITKKLVKPQESVEPTIQEPMTTQDGVVSGSRSRFRATTWPEEEIFDSEWKQGLLAADSALQAGEGAAERFYSAADAAIQFRAYREREEAGLRRINKFWVEIHKKGSIPTACIIFVLIGAPIAVRYPRGGVALVVGVSLAFFAAYYVALVGGEDLSDRRLISPLWAMWAPNILFGTFGLVALWRATHVTR